MSRSASYKGTSMIATCVMLAVLMNHGSALAQTPASQGRATSKVAQQDAEDHTEASADVSRQLPNPIANMDSNPFQFNWYHNIAPFDSTGFILKFQPDVPITLH